MLLTSNKSVPSSLRMPQGHQRLSSSRRTRSVPNVTTYATRASKAQLLTSNKSVPKVTSYATRASKAQLLTSNKSVPSVTSYATRASKAQLLTSNKSVPSVTTYATRASKAQLPTVKQRTRYWYRYSLRFARKDFTWRKCEDAVRAETASSRATCIIDIGKPQRDFLMSFHDTQSSIHASKFYRPMACA